jgi:capsular polysaccharide biosynthesis protein
MSIIGDLVYGVYLGVRDRVSARLRSPVQKLRNTILFGWSGVPAPAGIVNAENWASRTPEAGHASRPVDEQSIVFPQRKSFYSRASGSMLKEDLESSEAIERRLQPPFVVQIPRGRVAGRAGAVITPDNFLLCDTPLAVALDARDLRRRPGGAVSPEQTRCIEFAKGSKVMNRGPLPRAAEYNEAVAVICTTGSENYYHWMIDALPRLRLIEAAGLNADRYYVPMSAAYHREALRLLGIDEELCIPATSHQHIEARSVILPMSPGGLITPDICDFLRHRLLPNALSRTKSRGYTRLYITRRNAHWRKVTNETELDRIFKARGFTSVALEDYELADQIRMFHEAKYIVGPHGAGLTNLVFCKPGTRVLEISSPRRPRTMFYKISGCRRLRYLNFFADQDGPSVHGNRDSNIKVDLEQLEHALRLLDDAEPLKSPVALATDHESFE